MSVVEGTPQSGLVARVKNILLKPKEEWAVIDAEPATIKGLYTGYAMILAAIGPIAGLIGNQVFGVSALFVSFKPSLASSVSQAVLTYILSLGMIYVLALIIDALAPSFEGTKDKIQAFKVAVYASTASWVAAIFGLLPALAIIGALGGLYSLYLLFLGLPRLMKAPEEKALGYTAVTIIVALVLNVVVLTVVGSVMAATKLGTMGAGAMIGAANGGKITIPGGGGTVDLQKLEQASKQLEAAAQQAQNAQGGASPASAVDPAVLEAVLPAALPGYIRTKVSSGGGSVAGLGGTTAGATFDKGDSHIEVQVTDMGAMGALAGAFNVSANERTATGYEKVSQVNGRTVTEKYDTTSQSGHYGVLVGGRFMVQATGSKVSMDEMKAAVATVPESKLAGL